MSLHALPAARIDTHKMVSAIYEATSRLSQTMPLDLYNEESSYLESERLDAWIAYALHATGWGHLLPDDEWTKGAVQYFETGEFPT